MRRFARVAAAVAILALPGTALRAATHADSACPSGGTVRFGVEPFEAAARIVPAYEALGKLLGEKLGCPVEVSIPTSYNAEIEAMRSGKLEAGEFGPVGYVLAHRISRADVVATYGNAKGQPIAYYASIVTWPGSGIKTLKGVSGHSFAYSDPASTSGHLFPAYGLRKAGIDPDRGVQPLFAGSHTAAFETIRNHKADAGELNTAEIVSATDAGEYTPADWLTLWRSPPIPNDPITIRRDLPAAFKKRFTSALLALKFSQLPPDLVRVFPATGTTNFVPMPDASYDVIRDLVKTLGVDLNKLS